MEIALTDLILKIIAALIGTGITALIVMVCVRMKLQLTEDQKENIRRTIRDICWTVEEKYFVSGAENKLTQALALIKAKLPFLDELAADELIHQELPKIGLGVAGAELLKKASAPELPSGAPVKVPAPPSV